MSFAAQVETSGGAIHPIGSTLYGVCGNTASTVAKSVTLGNFDKLLTGITIHIKFLYGNIASNPTLNVNSTGDIPIYAYDVVAPGNTAATSWAANSMVSFTYDGTAWRMNDAGANAAMIALLEGEVTSEAAARATNDTGVATQIAEAYDSTATYTVGQLCIHDDKLYRCITPITTPEAWTSGHWAATTMRDETGITIKATGITAGIDGTVSASVSGTGITAATVDLATFESQITTTGTYEFTYNGATWEYSSSTVTLEAFGISVTGTPASGDKVTVSYTAGTNPFIANGTYPEYPFRAVIPMAGVLSTMVPEVILGMAEAITGQFAPVAETYNGGVYLYAASKPSASITIPIIVCRG